jgi:hypothetical protein
MKHKKIANVIMFIALSFQLFGMLVFFLAAYLLSVGAYHNAVHKLETVLLSR